MDYKPLPIGIDNFEKLVTREYYFVDKTLFIRELLDQKSDVNLFTRPRRFGKTLTLSMLQYFFEDSRDRNGKKIDNSGLFSNLNIMRAGETYLAHMGQYPVISLTLKEANQPDFDMASYQIRAAIADEYKRHSYILESDMLETDRKEYEAIMSGKADRNSYNTSIKFLSVCLEKYFGKKAIILIDEYDVPLESAHARGYYDEMVGFIRSLLSSALKTNGSLEFAVVIGCLRISSASCGGAQESIFTGLNNLKVISILNNAYDEYFGFTDGEARRICDDYSMTAQYETVKDWYNGYLFGNANVYNPWSVIQFIFDHREDPDRFPESYWANTSSNLIVRKLIEKADASVKQEIECLIGGGTVEKPVHEDITYDEVYENMDNLWNFMFFTGYFRKVSERMDEKTNIRYLTLIIPNEEVSLIVHKANRNSPYDNTVRYIFNIKILTWFQEQVRARDLSALYTAVVNKDTQTMERELSDILKHTISMPDQNENYYYGIMAGLLTGMPEHVVKSNRESGSGRSDLFILPLSRREEAFVMGFKKAKRISQLEEMADAAIRQIEEKQYKMQVYDDGYDIISSYGVAFCGKDCLVKHQ